MRRIIGALVVFAWSVDDRQACVKNNKIVRFYKTLYIVFAIREKQKLGTFKQNRIFKMQQTDPNK